MRYCVLGSTQAHTAEGSVVVGGPRVRALLTVLAVRAGRAVPVGVLVDEVWGAGAEPPAAAVAALQALVGRLRKAIGHERVESTEGGYRLAAEPDDVDAHRFTRLAAEGVRELDAGRPERAATLLDEALALWKGPALADLPDRAAEAAHWEARRLDARRARFAAALALGEAAVVLPELAALCAEHPLDESLQALRIRALRDTGRPSEALAAYERVRRELADRLGADPSPELRALHAGLLAEPAPAPAPEPVRAAAPLVGNLRARLTSFVGREDDISALQDALATDRLVTLLGPGGAGKTRLSQEAAERAAAGGGWPDGVWLVELAPVTDPEAVTEAVLGALGARETVLFGAGAEELRLGEDPLTRLVEQCAGRRLLILLDNCEHLVTAAAELTALLLARCPGVTVLATSREPLGVPGEVLRPLGPLPEETALRLFGERGAAARPGFSVDADRDAAAEIVRRLDGLPLAIELAAARLRMLTPRQIADRLDDRFRLLTSGARTVLPRQQTLRAVVDWSWDLLDAAERAVLRRLSVFTGGCDLEAAESVCAAPTQPPAGGRAAGPGAGGPAGLPGAGVPASQGHPGAAPAGSPGAAGGGAEGSGRVPVSGHAGGPVGGLPGADVPGGTPASGRAGAASAGPGDADAFVGGPLQGHAGLPGTGVPGAPGQGAAEAPSGPAATCGPVGPTPADVLDLLGSLVDKSLVVATPTDAGMRYRLLETVAEYAGERLDEAGDRAATERRHLVHYRELARLTDPELRNGRQLAAVARFSVEYGNLRTALRRAVAARDEEEGLLLVHALVWFWTMRDLRADALQWAEAVAALGPDPFGPERGVAGPLYEPVTAAPPPLGEERLWEARRGVRLIELMNMDHETGRWTTPEGVERLRRINAVYPPGLPQTCRLPGSFTVFAVLLIAEPGSMGKALDAHVEACRAYGYEWELANALQLRANMLANRADLAGRAAADAEESLEIFVRLDDAWGAAEALSSRAEARERRLEFDGAAEDFAAAIGYAERIGAQSQMALLRARYADMLMETGRQEEAERILRAVVDGQHGRGHEPMLAARIFLALLLGRTGRTDEARVHLRRLLDEFSSETFSIFEGFTLGSLGWVDVLDEHYASAFDLARRAYTRSLGGLSMMVAPQMPAIHLIVAAWALAGIGGPGARTAAVLLGAHEGLLPPGHLSSPLERQNRDRATELTRKALAGDEAVFAAAYAEGGGLSLEEAAALLERADAI